MRVAKPPSMKPGKTVVLGWLLTSLALAQPKPAPVPDYNSFLERVTTALMSGKYSETADWVRANPDFAKKLYATYYEQLRREKRSPAEVLLDDRLITIIALELEKAGDRSVAVEVKKRGWYQADMEGYHPKVRFSFDDPDFAAQLRAATGLLQGCTVSLALCDHSSVTPVASQLPSLVKTINETGRKLNLVDLRNTDEFLAFGNCLPDLIALERGDSAAVDDAKFFEKISTIRTAPVEALLFRALRNNANISRLKRVLAEGRKRGRASSGGLAEFVYLTFEFDLRMQQEGGIGPEEILQQAERAFQALRREKPLKDVPAKEIDLWVEILTPLLRDPKFRGKAYALAEEAIRTSQASWKEGQAAFSHLPSAWPREALGVANEIQQQHLRLRLVHLCLQMDRRDVAWKTLESLGPHARFRDQVQDRLKKLEAAMAADMPDSGDLARLKEPGIVLLPFEPHLRHGSFARLMEEWIGLEMSLDPDRSKLPALFAEADAFGQLARPNLGWMVFDDPRWIYLDILFEKSPGEAAAPILDSLQKDCDRLAFRPGQARILAYRAKLNPHRAQELLNQAVTLVEQHLNEFGATPAGRERLKYAYQPIYTALARLQIEQGKGEQAFETLQRQQQADALNRSSVNLAGDSRSEALQRIRGEGQELSAQFQANAQAGRDNAKTEHLLAKNKAEFHTVLDDLRRQYPTYESALAIRPVNFSKSQKYLPADTAVVQYFPTADALYIFVVTRQKLVIRQVPVGEKQLRRDVAKALDEIFRPVNHPRNRYSFEDTDPYLEPLKGCLCGLYQQLIAPIEGDLGGVKVLAFIPTGSLHYVPFAALARARGNGLEFLVERYPCVSLVKSSDLEQVGRQPTPGGGTLLALGNPDGTLPGAEVEVGKITHEFKKFRCLVGKQATAASLKKLDPGTTYVHMATHGVLDSADPKRSYLTMAGENLTLTDIYELKLDSVRLVTLSACQTARESSNPGSEIASLAEAFSIAGTNSVVATLWSISDTGTVKLMTEFYKGLASKRSLASSLQQAELTLLKDPATAHPYFWAPFVMLGDWR